MTDRPTDQPTDRPTDKAGCRVACTRLRSFSKSYRSVNQIYLNDFSVEFITMMMSKWRGLLILVMNNMEQQFSKNENKHSWTVFNWWFRVKLNLHKWVKTTKIQFKFNYMSFLCNRVYRDDGVQVKRFVHTTDHEINGTVI